MAFDNGVSRPGCLAQQHTCDCVFTDGCQFTLNCSNSVSFVSTLGSAITYSGIVTTQGTSVNMELHLNPNTDAIRVVYTDNANFYCVYNGGRQ
jgi:hypothetical protein